MTIYNSPGFNAKLSGNAHGESRSTNRMHETIALPAGLSAGDVINIGYLPPNSVVSGLNLKTPTQLDASGAPTIAIDVGVVGNTQLFNAASVVGRVSGCSADTTLLPAGRLYKNTSGGKQTVMATVHAPAAAPLAGFLEVEISYFVEEPGGSPA